MFCATHLVECLRNRGINPVALENTWYSSSYPKYALQYNKSKVYHSLEFISITTELRPMFACG